MFQKNKKIENSSSGDNDGDDDDDYNTTQHTQRQAEICLITLGNERLSITWSLLPFGVHLLSRLMTQCLFAQLSVNCLGRYFITKNESGCRIFSLIK